MITRGQSALMLLVAGFTLWSGAFVLLYGVQALGCAYGWPHHRLVLIATYLASLAPLGWLAFWRPDRSGEPQTTLSLAARWANRAAFGAGVLVFLPVTFTSLCV